MVLEETCWQKDLENIDATLTDYESLGAIGVTTGLAKYPELAVPDRRIATFLTYPYGGCKSVEELVDAGYFFMGEQNLKNRNRADLLPKVPVKTLAVQQL